MSPYRQPAEVDPEPEVERSFWERHPNVERVLLIAFLVLVVIPIRILACPFTGEHPLDF